MQFVALSCDNPRKLVQLPSDAGQEDEMSVGGGGPVGPPH